MTDVQIVVLNKDEMTKKREAEVLKFFQAEAVGRITFKCHRTFRWFLFYKHDILVGTICMESDTYNLRLLNVLVHKDFRRQGICTTMLDLIDKWCITENIDKNSLEPYATIGIDTEAGYGCIGIDTEAGYSIESSDDCDICMSRTYITDSRVCWCTIM
jgi:GNAT superfamily N-acetyltransferase